MDASIRRQTLLVAAFISASLGSFSAQEPQRSTQEAQRDAVDSAKLIEVLEIRPGATVADIGAGSGPLVTPLSKHVGSSGRVYATDVNADRISELKKLAASASLENVTVLEGGAAQTNLPEGCCDAIYMRLVYHHFGDPAAMNASLLKSLKPGGRIAVIEFKPKTGTSAPPGKRADGDSHGVMPETVIEELKAAGFTDVRVVPWPSEPSIAIVGQKPARMIGRPSRARQER
jgi:ubiquinone/menaquinone biosynthesis C-methylase UbiE